MKKFIIIGNQNAITYKEIFPYIKNNQLWWGTDCIRWFIMPSDTDKQTKLNNNGEVVSEGARSRWYTNIPHTKRNIPLGLHKRYYSEDYPKYDNYDAIEVSKVSDIPMDYNGVMGVPITFLDKYCPEQFEIVGFFNSYKPETADIEDGQIYGEAVKINSTKSLYRGPVVNGKATYFRIFIRKRHKGIRIKPIIIKSTSGHLPTA